MLKPTTNPAPVVPPSCNRQHPLRDYLVASLCLGAALAVRLVLEPFWGTARPYATFIAVFVVIVWFTGRGASLFAIVASFVLADCFFVTPSRPLGFTLAEWVDHGFFFFICGALLFFAHRARTALAALKQEQARLQNLNAELEQRVLERTRSLQETTTQLNAFCHSIAHDLKAPIRAQASYAEILLQKCGPSLSEEGRTYAERIAKAAQRQGKLVSDLLALASLGRSEMPMEPVDLANAVQLACVDLQSEFEHSGALLHTEGLEGCLLANPSSLHLVLLNLLSNALKFVARGTRPEVKVEADWRDGVVRLWVQDNGIGIPPQLTGKLFGVFQRLHSNGSYPGTGIGLALVKQAVERMGGRVGVESEPGKGSRFWVELAKAPVS